ncbi:Cytochrome P450 89A2 [Rhizoctonia solani]|uniref:Cytochrome P450 89A2 n=1 Tax=Rhizoctonia solani TaxID=456999 RepID=A0A0K6FK00_9AGAM|nr:Cytochrome P450 89A2 [Rhizoctonia solani]
MYAALATTAVVVLLSALLARLPYLWILPRPLPDIPHNPITSLLGDVTAIAQYEKDGKGVFTDFIAHLTAIHGPILQILLPRRRIVVVADRVEAERIILSGKAVDTSERLRKIFATALPNSQLALPANEVWKKHRRLAGPSMSRRYLERMASRISFGANELVGLWRAKIGLVGNSAFDVAMDFHLATMLPQPDFPPLYKAGEVIAEGFKRALQSPCPGITTCDAIARTREREAGLGRTGQGLSTNADCVLDMIVQREIQEGAEALGDKDILDELITYFFGGQDTTASVLSWLVKYLPIDPEIQRQLHDEMCTVFGVDAESAEPLDFNVIDDPERVPILEAVVAETLRCAGVASIISRELLRDEVILGRLIPKGTQLFFATGLMSKSEAEWGSDAKEWRPSRWLTLEGAFNRSAGPSIPFGMGQRSCFGQRLAVLQLKIYVATMSREFFFKPVPPEVDSWEASELILRRPKMSYVSLERWDFKSE